MYISFQRFNVSATGQLSTLTSLDREEAASYHLTLIASDGGMPALMDTTELLVNVEDINDEPPVFGVSAHIVELIEGQDYSDFITFQVCILAGEEGFCSFFLLLVHVSLSLICHSFLYRQQMLMQHLLTA